MRVDPSGNHLKLGFQISIDQIFKAIEAQRAEANRQARRAREKEQEALQLAEQSARLAEAARLTAEAIDAKSTDPTLALRLTHEACRISNNQSLLAIKTRHDLLADPQLGFCQKRFFGHAGRVLSVAFSPDGQSILTGSSDQTARLWSLERELSQTFSGHAGDVSSVAFSPACPEELPCPFGSGQLILLGTQRRYHYLFRNMIYALENNDGVIELTEAQRKVSDERY